MAQAKTMKLKEYNPDILSHQVGNIETPQSTSIRFNNTFKSTALSSELANEPKRTQPKSRDKLF